MPDLLDLPEPEMFLDEPYKHELLGIIQEGIDKHERSHQVQVGPSEVGGCARKLVWKLAYGGDGEGPGGWAAHKGTLMHAWLDEQYKECGRLMPDGTERFMSDMKLTPVSPDVAGGTLDLYDRLHQRVVDWKVPGDGTMDKARANTLSRGYFVQAQIYAYGLVSAGHSVTSVGLMFLAQCGDDLHKKAVARFWKYDERVAQMAFEHVARYRKLLEIAPVSKVLAMAPTMSDFCQNCPVYMGNGDRRAMCPGSTKSSRVVDRDNNPFAR
jgi:hypothetical protein